MSSDELTTTYLDTSVYLWYFSKPKASGNITLQEAKERQIIARTLFEEAQQKKRKILTSIYTKIEIAFIDEEATIKRLDPAAPEKIDALLNDTNIMSLLNVSNLVAEKARGIVRLTKVSDIATVKPKDAIHIASALVYGADELFTYDEGMCKWDSRIEGLRICKPLPPQMPMF